MSAKARTGCQVSTDIRIMTERRRTILKIVVQEYVATARAVSSGTIEAKYGLGVSSATVRNELAKLEEMGYLLQPHTSGGRVPTDRGYRYYVEDLMDEPAVSGEERRMIAHQFHQVQLDMTEWLRLTAAVLAHSVRNAAVVTAPKANESRVKHLELISIQDTLSLLVLVLHGGLVQQQMLVLRSSMEQEELSGCASRLNRALAGKTSAQIEQGFAAQHEWLEGEVVASVVRLMRAHDQEDRPILHYDGLAHIMHQPEFDGSAAGRAGRRVYDDAGAARPVGDSLLQLLGLLQQGLLFRRLLPQAMDSGGVQVFIGGEGEHEDLRHYSMIVSRYGSAGSSGMLGVLGPTRMHYGRAVAVVRYMTELMTDLSGELHG